MTRGKSLLRLAAVAGTASLALTLFPSAANAAARDTASACQNVPDQGFTDTAAAGTEVHDSANCIAAYGVSNGKTATTYDPSGTMTRAQMTAMIMRKLDKVNGFTRPSNSPNAFLDDDNVQPAEFHKDINDAHALGIVDGKNVDVNGDGIKPDFDANGSVTRGQMAKFIVKQFEAAGATVPSNPPDAFTDDNGSPFETYINQLAAMGIVQGKTANSYDPNGIVNRGQMAVFIARDLAELVDQGLLNPIGGGTGITATPAGETGVTFAPTTEGGTGDKFQTVSFSGLDSTKTYDVALFPCATPDTTTDQPDSATHGMGPQIVTGSGAPVFRDADANTALGTPDSQADNEGETTDGDIAIATIDQVPQSDATYVNNQSTDGSMDVTIHLTSQYGDCAFVVVFQDANGNNELDLNADNTPAESAGVAGPFIYSSHEAPNGEDSSYDIVWKSGNTVYTDAQYGYFFIVKAADRPTYDDGSFPVSPDQWVKDASLGDAFDFYDSQSTGYGRTGGSEFDLYIDSLNPPTDVKAVQGDFDSPTPDGVQDDVKVTWTAPNPLDGELDHYEVYEDGVFKCSTVSIETQCSIINDAPGTHTYRVTAVSYSGEYSDRSEPISLTVNTPAPGAVAGAPISQSAISQDKDSNAQISAGDVIVLTFNEKMDAPAAGDKFTVSDADGTVADIINGVNSTWALSADGGTITVTMTAGPSITTVGTTLGVQYPATVTGSTGVTDADEHLEWNTATGDVTF